MRREHWNRLAVAFTLSLSGCVYHSESIVYRSGTFPGHRAGAGSNCQTCCLQSSYPGAVYWAEDCNHGAAHSGITHRISVHRLSFDFSDGCVHQTRPCAGPTQVQALPGCEAQPPHDYFEPQRNALPAEALPVVPPPVPANTSSSGRTLLKPEPHEEHEPGPQFREPMLIPPVATESQEIELAPPLEPVVLKARPELPANELPVESPLKATPSPDIPAQDADDPVVVPANEIPLIKLTL